MVIADLTGLNPNVLYELGICHGLNIPAVLLTQDIDEVPFDLRAYRLQVYSTTFHEAEKLSTFLGKVAAQHRCGEITFGSPVSDFLRRPPGRASGSESADVPNVLDTPRKTVDAPIHEDSVESDPADASERSEDRSSDSDQELGWLDLISERDAVLNELTATYELMTESISEMGARLNERSEQIGEITAAKVPGAASSANRVASLAARDMSKHAQELQDLLPVLEPNSERLIELLTDPRILSLGDKRDSEEREATSENLKSLLRTNRESLASVKKFRSSVQGLRDQGISREINRAAATLRLSLDRVINSMEVVESGLARVVSLLEGESRSTDGDAGNDSEPSAREAADAASQPRHDMRPEEVTSGARKGTPYRPEKVRG